MPDDVTFLKQYNVDLEELTCLALTLGSALNVDQILSAIIDSCLKLCRAERAAVLLYGPTSKELVKTLVRSSEESKGEIDHRLNLILAGWIERNKRPFVTHDIVEGLELKKPSEEWRQLGPALAVPLIVSGEIIGIVNLVNSRGGSAFSDDMVGIAAYISALAAQFIQRARLHETLFEDNRRLKSTLQQQYDVGLILGKSQALRDVLEKIPLAGSSVATVLLMGESGTGKELVARAIHFHGDRANKPFVAINCAAIPAALFESELFGHERGAFTGATEALKGKFELANQGTLFLDEISEMPLELQPKLLRVLEDCKFFRVGSSTQSQVDVRLITATNKDLKKVMQEGKFREDLFYRLNVIPIVLPPLRERVDDIPILAQAFLDQFSAKTKRFTKDALDILQRRQWKGNIRELRNFVERASIFTASKDIAAEHLMSIESGVHSRAQLRHSEGDTKIQGDLNTTLQALLHSNTGESDLMEVIEEQLVQLALQRTNGNVRQAARLLGIDHKALHRRLDKYKS